MDAKDYSIIRYALRLARHDALITKTEEDEAVAALDLVIDMAEPAIG